MKSLAAGLVMALAILASATVPALATPMVVGSPDNVHVGQSVMLDIMALPSGTPVGAFNLVFSFSNIADMSFDSLVCGAGLLCSQSSTGFSVSGEFASTALTTSLSIAQVGVTGLMLGGKLNLLTGSNFTNFDTFQDIAVGPAVVAEVVVPEPSSMLLLGTGLASFFARRRVSARRHNKS